MAAAPLLRLVPAALAVGAALAGPAAAQQGGAAAAQVQALEEEVRRLNGRIQELEHLIRRLAEDGARRIGDLEYRIVELEGGDPSLVGDPPPLGQAGSRVAAAAPVAVSERVALDEAKARLEAGDAQGARIRLVDFLNQYGDGPLAPEGQHFLGLAEYRLGEWGASAQSFLTAVTAFPADRHAPANLLMLGRSLEKLGTLEEACATWAEVLARHPGSTEAADAKADRVRLGCR